MTRIIEIHKCSDCPHISHTGAFTKGGAKPCCNHPETVKLKGHNCFNRVIPYHTSYTEVIERTVRRPKRIPDWCPLSKLGQNTVA